MALPTPRSAIRHRKLAKREMLFHQGDSTDAIFVVQRGRVRLVRHLADGSRITLYVAQEGSIFSEAALFSKTYHCDAVADVDSVVEIHPKDALKTAFVKNGEATEAFMTHLAHQVIVLRSRLETRNIRSAFERVLHFLRLEVGEHDSVVTFNRPLKDIASEIGLTHETFYRTLAQLETQGQISRNGKSICLLSNLHRNG